jgi:uncharacterized protein (TIGR03000 family)
MRTRFLGGCAACLALLLAVEPAMAQRGGGGGGRGGGGGGGGRVGSGGGGGGRGGSGGGRGMAGPATGGRGAAGFSGSGRDFPGGGGYGRGYYGGYGRGYYGGYGRGYYNDWGWGGWGIGFGIPLYIGAFGPGVWMASDYPGYFSYYSEGGDALNGVYYGAPMNYDAATPPNFAAADLGFSPAAQAPPDNLAFVTIRVPNSETKVWIEDVDQKDSGAVREYRSPELKPGHKYTYEIRAEWKEGDQVRKQTRKFPIHAGDHIMVVFGPVDPRKDEVPPIPPQEKIK